MAALGAEIFARGFRFAPTPLEAATYYLPRLIAGAPLHEAVRAVVHHADVYACEPGDLAAEFRPLPKTGERYFFTSCKKRTRVAGPGSWSLQSTKAVKGGAGQAAEVVVGEIKKFRYKKGGVMTDWLMDEFSTCCCSEEPASDRQFVLCKIYVSPRADKNSAARQETAAFLAAQQAPAAAVAMTQQPAPKRPAPPQVSAPPCPKRMRGAVTPTMQPAGCTASLAPPRHYVPHITASAQPPPPIPIFASPPRHSPAIAPPCPLAQMPPPVPLPPMVHSCHMPVEAPAHHYWPQPSVQRKQRMLDPFEAAEVRDAAEEERITAPHPMEPPAVLVDQDDESQKCMEYVLTPEGSTIGEDDEMDQTKQSTGDPSEAAEVRDEAEKESVAAPADPAEDFDIDEIYRSLEENGNFSELARLLEDDDSVPTAEAGQAAANLADGAPVPASKEPPAALHQAFDLDDMMSLDAVFKVLKHL